MTNKAASILASRKGAFLWLALIAVCAVGCKKDDTSTGGQAGTGVAGTGVAGTGVAGTGVAGTGVAGTGVAGTGVAGTAAAGTGAAGTAAGTAAAGTGAAGTGAAGTGAAGTGSGMTCEQKSVASGQTMACATCVCTKCKTELDACTMDTMPSPNPTVTDNSGVVCQGIIDCTVMAKCKDDQCWCGCTNAPDCCGDPNATNWMMAGPCKDAINKGASMASTTAGLSPYYPGPSDKQAGAGHPIGNSSAIGVCQKAMCMTECM